jgi:hypothetical protein
MDVVINVIGVVLVLAFVAAFLSHFRAGAKPKPDRSQDD